MVHTVAVAGVTTGVVKGNALMVITRAVDCADPHSVDAMPIA